MSKRRAIPTLLVAIVALLDGCQERPTAPSVPDDLNPQMARGGSHGPAQTVTFTFRSSDLSDGWEDLIAGDGRIMDAEGRTTYTGGECGVGTLIPGYNGNASLNTKNSRIKPSEEAECDNSREGRYFEVSFDRYDDGPDLPWDGQIVRAKWVEVYSNIRSIPKGTTSPRLMKITFEDNSEKGTGGNGWGQACPFLLRFDKNGWPPYASDVQVERLQQQTAGYPVDEWRVKTGDGPDEDVAVCLGLDGDQPIVLGYYHVPFEFTVVCDGEC
jgi:hypothetical protein